MNEQQQYSDIEIIEDSINSIGRIRVPIEMDDIGNELSRIRRNLMLLHDAMVRNFQEKQQAEQPVQSVEPEEEPIPEIVSEEMTQG